MKKIKKTIMAVVLTSTLCLCLTGCKMTDYNDAIKLQNDGNYEEALRTYKSIDNYENYKDAAENVKTCEAMIDAIDKFNDKADEIQEKNAKLDSLISDSEDLIAKKETALDDTLIPALETSISEAKAARKDVPEMPDTADEILNAVKDMETIDYMDVSTKLSDSKAALEKSIKQYALVYQPDESYIIDCLGKVEHIVNISAVTEDNDPNGNLNKPGGYTSTVYYSDDRINFNKSIYGTTVIEQGTDGGGAIEVYSTVEDAEKRNEYLSSFDGTPTASGTHTIIGTVLIRTSNKLKASEQKEAEANIIDVLTSVD